MRKTETISAAEFKRKSQIAIANAPIRKEVALSSIEVIKENILKVDGTLIQMDTQGFKGVCKAIGLPIGFDKTFSESFGDKARQTLINKLKIATQSKGKTTVSLVVNPEKKKIIDVISKSTNIISNKSFLETTTQIIDKYGLEVNNFSVSDDGQVAINTSSASNMWGVEGLKNEDFYGGISFDNSPDKGFNVSPFLMRLVCANGMMGKSFQENFNLNKIGVREMEVFWASLNELATRNFRPHGIEDRIKMAIGTNASLGEMENAYNILRDHSGAQFGDLDSWIPLGSTKNRFHAHGIDTVMLSAKQKNGAMTGTSIWDLVNACTHFGTHDNGFTMADMDRRKIQIEASKLLTKDYDMGNLISSPFDKKMQEVGSSFGTKFAI